MSGDHISADTLRRIQGYIADLSSADDDEAQRAERRLIRFGAKAVKPLIIAAASENPQVRFRAVWALGKSRDERALPTILRLTEDPDQRVAYDAVLALGELGDLRALPRLEKLAGQAEDDRSLVSASRMALTKLGHPVLADSEEDEA